MDYPLTSATVTTLPNGLTVILDPHGASPVVSAQIWVETGSIHESDLLGSGLSHFLEHMVFKGTPEMDASMLAHAVQAAGGHWNAYTTYDRTVYYIDGPSDSLPTFLDCLCGIVFRPTLPADEFEKEKAIIRREIDMGLDDPDRAEHQLFFQTAFAQDPRRQPVIGHPHLVDRLTHADLLAYHAARYTPDRTIVAISGVFAPARALARLTRLTVGCTPMPGANPHLPTDPPLTSPRRGHGTFPIPNTRLTLAWKCPPLHHPLTPALEVLAVILGHGRSSRLHRTLREETPLAIEISASHWSFPALDGLFAIHAEVAPANRTAITEAIHGLLHDLGASTLDAELAKARRQILSSQFRTLVTASGRAADLASNWHVARDLDFTRHHVAAIAAVTTDDLLRAAATLTPATAITTMLDPEGTAAPREKSRVSSAKAASIGTRVMANGIALQLLPDRRVPIVHLYAAIRGGLPAETRATNGINHLLAATLPKATAHLDVATMADTLESLGATLSAAAGNNSLLVHASCFREDLPTVARHFADTLACPAFPADSTTREAESLAAAIREAASDPLHSAFVTLRTRLFGATGYGLHPTGNTEVLPRLTPRKLLAHHASHFTAGNITLALAGDLHPAEAAALLADTSIAQIQPGTWTPPPTRHVAGRTTRATLAHKNQAVIAIGFPACSALDPDRHALALLHEYSSSMSGPLFTRIREELGLCYRIGSTQFLGHDTGMFAFYLATSPEHVAQAHHELLAQIQLLATHGIPTRALPDVRAAAISAHGLATQSPAALARTIAIDTLFGLPADHHRSTPATYATLSPAKIRAAARRIFSATPATIIVTPE